MRRISDREPPEAATIDRRIVQKVNRAAEVIYLAFGEPERCDGNVYENIEYDCLRSSFSTVYIIIVDEKNDRAVYTNETTRSG